MRFVSAITASLLGIALMAPTPVSAYCLKKVNGATPYVAWKTFPVNYKISSNLTDPKILKAIDDAFTTWGSVSCSKLKFKKAGTFDIAKTKFDGHNAKAILVFWFTNKANFPTDPKYIAYTFINHDNAGAFVDASIAVNAFTTKTFPWSTTGDAKSLDVQGELTTLIGQVIGLRTSNTPASVMQDAVKFADVAKRTLAPDDIDGIHQLYNQTNCPAPPAPGANGCSGAPPGLDGGTTPGIDGGTTPSKDGGTTPSKDGGTTPSTDGGTTPPKTEAGLPVTDQGGASDTGTSPGVDSGAKACTSSAQCASDEICTAEGRCVKLGDGSGGDGGCCSVATSTPPAGMGIIFFILGVVWFATRRRV